MKSITERRIVQVAAIAKAAELDGIECTVRHIANSLGMAKSARTNELVHLAQKHGLVKIVNSVGDNGNLTFLVAPVDHYLYETLEETIKAYRKEIYS